MKIGIDASRAFLKDRTGIEEYSYQVIKNLAKIEGEQARLASTSGHLRESRRVVLYLRKNQEIDFTLPNNWKVKIIKWPRFWTQFGLSLEIFLHPVDALFIPAHTVPCIHPARTIVTIHGLEYEFCPEAYSFWERLYMRSTIKKSCKWASKIIAVSENTKKDLIKLYKVPADKIEVIYEGYENSNQQPVISNQKNTEKENSYELRVTSYGSYLLFIGRLEERKNIVGIIKSFEVLKERYKIPHKLVLAGKPGFGYEKIKNEIANVNCVKDIIETGFVSAEEKNYLLNNAAVFVFPTLYEGFGLPILEAQNAGVPVVASIEASIPEVAGDSALLVDSNNAEEIADAVYKIISDENIKKDLIQKGLENIQRFSWEKCGKEIADILKK
ncbi:MAG TPA: glycosyltransferase family 1 protein [Candidatus Moranbacteria bacterium]|nr:glycosyltransferase family 1 protein [Candidatus Moranbacteria bacterium]